MFIDENKARLDAYVELSQQLGARADYVQGGGGNTSVKLNETEMAIKASGFKLSDIQADTGYAVLNYAAISDFYHKNEAADLADVEKEGAACTKENTLHIEGLEDVRPSVEAGFHSILKTYVAHTHSVYANLVCCAKDLEVLAKKAFDGADYTWGWVPYTDPGANLTFAIRDELARVEKESGKKPSVMLMQNHGIIVHDDDADSCLKIHADANERLAQALGLHDGDFPAVSIREVGSDLFESDTPFLTETLASGKYSYEQLMTEPLYPDQMVFLTGTLFADQAELEEGTAKLDTASGKITYKMPAGKARVLEETLTAVCFIMVTLQKEGIAFSTMGEAAKNFIANWESEKYRKSLASK